MRSVTERRTTAGVEAPAGEKSSNIALEAQGVTKSFQSRSGGQVEALTSVTMEVPKGEFLAIVGPSGCGKSTLLRLFAGLDTPTTGDVRMDGKTIHKGSSEAGFVFQSSVLLPWLTVIENVLLPAKVRHGRPTKLHIERARELLDSVGLLAFEKHYPRELSGGMRQRAAICRALHLDPKILLMDEPFGALDAITRLSMNRDLAEIWRSTGKTIVFVTHDVPEAVRLGSRVITMAPRPGRVTSDISLAGMPASYDERLGSPHFAEYAALLHKSIEI